MPSNSLAAIEKTLTQLWMNRSTREKFLTQTETEQIDKEGVQLYAQLLNYGHQDLMLNIYPYCAKLLGDKWTEIVDDYLEKYPPNHFNLNRTASRFPQYLSEFDKSYIDQFPFIIELAHYEWLEMELLEENKDILIHEQIELSSLEQFAKFMPVVNPVLRICHYRFPIIEIVEKLQEDSLPKKIKSKITNIAIYRDPDTHKCRFLELDEMTSKIIEAAMTNKMSYQDLVMLALKQNSNMDPQKNVLEFIEMTERLQDCHLFVGSVPIKGVKNE